jgi:undecaprenyl-diphosphatase
MVWIERRYRRTSDMQIDQVTLRQALFIGVCQCLSIVPGTSRAMVTIMGGIAAGLPPAVAAEFSFYLAIPTLCGAGLLRLAKHGSQIQPDMVATLGLGFSVSFVVALLVIAVFMRYLQTRSLWPFAIYRVALGIAVLTWGWASH